MTEMAADFSTPRVITNVEECDFYHTIEIPGLGLVKGQWDLRPIVDQYLGGVSFTNKRVLEIGPASGFLTIEMEKRGASVVAVEITDDPGWDFVPYPASVMDKVYGPRSHHMNRVKNSFWFTHAAYKSRAKLLYGNVYNLPDWLGLFDIAIMGAILLHCHSPLQIVEQCARRAKTLIISDVFRPDLEGRPVCQLIPTRENRNWDSWWRFSTDLFTQFLGVMDFSCRTSTYADERGRPQFTLVGTKGESGGGQPLQDDRGKNANNQFSSSRPHRLRLDEDGRPDEERPIRGRAPGSREGCASAENRATLAHSPKPRQSIAADAAHEGGIRPRILFKLSNLPRLDRKNALAHALPCKVCGSLAPFFDVVDFNKMADETNCYAFGPSDIPVVYHRCGHCGLLFTAFFDDWATDDFRRFIYNADYALVDAEYAERRPRRTAERIAGLLSGLNDVRIIDYGSGSGLFAGRMAELGFKGVQEYDPFSHPTRPMGPFDVILCHEVLEHSPSPLETMGDMKSLLSKDGCIILGEGLQPADIERVRANWWYCAPRNGHCSMFAERTLSILATRLGLLFHRGSALIFRLRDAGNGIEIARRVNSPEPYVSTTLFVPNVPHSDSLHSIEKGRGRPFRWTAQERQEWTIDVASDSPATLEVGIPFVMEVEPDFAGKCEVMIGDQPAKVSIAESTIVASARRVSPGTTKITLLMPEHKSPEKLCGAPDNRRLGLALVVSS